MIGITTAVVHDRRIRTKDDRFAVKLRITSNREQKYFPIGKHLSIDEWESLQSNNPKNKELKRLKLLFAEIEKKAIKIIDEMDTFSFQLFDKKFNQKAPGTIDVLDALNEKKDSLILAGRLNSSESYKSAIRSLGAYLKTSNRKKIKFSEITPDWLEGYEKWMVTNGSSITTIGIYLRNLRTVINQAIEDGALDSDSYPFGKRKYQIPASKNIKKALVLEDIKRIVYYTPFTDAEAKARDLWIFSYLCNGLNVKDIAKLQYKNLSSKHITFVRAKTERSTKTNQTHISIVRIPEIDEIISRWCVKSDDPNAYVFGILSADDSPEKQLANIKQATKTINKYMKRIGEKLGIDIKLTTYSARHSFATVLKRSGAPIEFISESLGHKDLRTTENYLDSFEDDIKEQYQKRLLNFKK